MVSPDTLTSISQTPDNDGNNQESAEEFATLKEEVVSNFSKPNIPNVNVPEKIIICMDTCFDNSNSLYRLGDGTTFTPINMMKRVLDFFLHTKTAINCRTEFAIVTLKNAEPCWVHDFTNNIKDLISVVDSVTEDECTSETFDLKKLFDLVEEKIEIPDYKEGECIIPPPYVVRMLVLYGRSSCLPLIPHNDPYFIFLKKQLYFYIDILLAHEEDCALYKCEEIYDALQDLDNGYSYVFEVSRNATKIHDCIAKLLAHPLQRPLQKNTDYLFGIKQ